MIHWDIVISCIESARSKVLNEKVSSPQAAGLADALKAETVLTKALDAAKLQNTKVVLSFVVTALSHSERARDANPCWNALHSEIYAAQTAITTPVPLPGQNRS